MNANRTGLARSFVVALLCLSAGASYGVQNLNAPSQTKVNNAMAKAWQKGGNPNDPALQKRVVNIGSKRNNTCNVNVGTAQTGRPGQRAPKDVVVTTKEVINVCK